MMIAPVPLKSEVFPVEVKRFLRGWALGTGLPVSLPPGQYEITAEETFDGVRYLRLDRAWRIPAGQVEQPRFPYWLTRRGA